MYTYNLYYVSTISTYLLRNELLAHIQCRSNWISVDANFLVVISVSPRHVCQIEVEMLSSANNIKLKRSSNRSATPTRVGCPFIVFR